MDSKSKISNIEEEILYFTRMSFDSDPNKRIQAINGLAKHVKNPSALYVLYELTHDLDHEVRSLAKKVIEDAKGEYLSSTIKEVDEKLFEALTATKKEEKALIEEIEELEEEILACVVQPKEAIDILKDLKIKILSSDDHSLPLKKAEEHEEKEVRTYFEGIKNLDIDSLTEEQIAKIDSLSLSIEKKPVYKHIYDFILKTNPSQKQLKAELKRILKDYERELKFAADVAWYRLKKSERQLNLMQLREGMRNINLENLEVVEIGETRMRRGRKVMYVSMIKVREHSKKDEYALFQQNPELGESQDTQLKEKTKDEIYGYILIEKHRVEGLKVNDIIDIEKANVITHDNKIALVLSKNSNLLIRR
ncbi:MAG: hypothetical protein N3E37_01560 [Candidatus Micrarchaeota archaeon]|nr:hypothetical protein [Candidatus Micrarchaeota archaeon]